MTFTETAFAWFLPLVFCGWWLLRRFENLAIGWLLIASLGFYGHNHWKLLPVLLAYCICNWWIATRIEKSRYPGRVLATGLVFNLSLLAYFKYAPLLVQLCSWLFKKPDWMISADQWEIPYGISFFAFTGIAYMVDVYRKVHPAFSSLSRYSLSAVFFPHLVAGPILRPNEFLNRLAPGDMPQRSIDPLDACYLIARGFFKKVVLADRIAEAINPFFAHIGDTTTAGVCSLPYIYLYALQIYFDFSAYTDIARGIAKLFGYDWPENFNLPYLATSVTDFWHRWHMTLSRFLRDYLYIPLGGSRHGWWHTNRNLMITMLLGGLWHGASWSFLIWGGLHGLYLVAHRVWIRFSIRNELAEMTGMRGYLWKGACVALTFNAVCVAWCFFRLTNWSESILCLRKVVDFDWANGLVGPAYDPSLWIAILGYGGLVAIASALRQTDTIGVWGFRKGLSWSFMFAWFLLALLLAPGTQSEGFIYFQF